jgi:hypothetical protein
MLIQVMLSYHKLEKPGDYRVASANGMLHRSHNRYRGILSLVHHRMLTVSSS